MKSLQLIGLMLLVLSANACDVVNGSPCRGDLPCCVDSKTIATCEQRSFSPQGTWSVDKCDSLGSPCLNDGGYGAQCV